MDNMQMYSKKGKPRKVQEKTSSATVSKNNIKINLDGKVINLPSIDSIRALEKQIKIQKNEIRQLRHDINQLKIDSRSTVKRSTSNNPESPF